MANGNNKRTFVGENVTVAGARLNWAGYLFKKDDDGPNASGKYRCDLLIPKSRTGEMKDINTAIKAAFGKAFEEGVLSKDVIGSQVLKAVKSNTPLDPDKDGIGWPVKDGDKYADDRIELAVAKGKDREQQEKFYEPYRGMWLITATSSKEPDLADIMGNPVDRESPEAKRMFYSGALVYANLFLCAYQPSKFVTKGGVTAWLNGVQFWKKGKPLGNGGSHFTAINEAMSDGFDDLIDDGGADDTEAPSSTPSDANDGWGDLV